MRIKNVRFLVTAAALILWSVSGQAQSKYDRPSSKKSTALPADDKSASTKPGDKKSEGDKKVDISDLENRYWTEKDTNFSVVQNRLYTKAKKFSVSAIAGTSLNDAFANNFSYGATVNYFFSEREGLGLDLWRTSASDNSTVQQLASLTTIGSTPNHNLAQGYIGANYVWVPIYAKMSVLEKKIIYFDMSFSPGLGVTWLKSAAWQNPTGSAFPAVASKDQYLATLALDIAQHFFLSEHLALRIDLKTHIYNEALYNYLNGSQVGNNVTVNGTILFGLSYFFDAPQKPEEVKTK